MLAIWHSTQEAGPLLVGDTCGAAFTHAMPFMVTISGRGVSSQRFIRVRLIANCSFHLVVKWNRVGCPILHGSRSGGIGRCNYLCPRLLGLKTCFSYLSVGPVALHDTSACLLLF